VADLYKLLAYDPGSFFVNHRDTEKVAGMFATLIIVLPSVAERLTKGPYSAAEPDRTGTMLS
jgi:hypothetical protein